MSLATDEAKPHEAAIDTAPTSPAGRTHEPFGEISLFHSTLADMCRSERPLPQALSSLQHELSSGGLREDCATMAAEMQSGMPFEESYARRAESFPPIYRALIETGLQTGDLPGVLEEISVDASLRARVRDQLRRRLALPLMAAAMVFVIGAALTLLLTPLVANSEPLAPGRSEAFTTPPTGMLLLTSVALLALLATIGIAVAALRKPLDPGAGPRGLGYRLPLIGRLRSYAAKAGFASTMALLLRRQIPLAKALELCAAGCDGQEVQDQVRRMAKCASGGGGLCESLQAGDLIPPSLLWLTESAGSEAASSRVLDDIASVYRQRLQRATDRLAVFALPVLELIIGLVVLSFAMAYVLPTYNVFGLFRL